MDTPKEARKKILVEITADAADVRAEYIRHFEDDAQKFSYSMSQAFIKWRTLDAAVEGSDERAYISAIVHTAIHTQVVSMKLFLSGYTVAAGNLFRQVIESIALALVCSRKDLGILDQFMDQKYSTNNAVRDVLRHRSKLGLKEDGVGMLKDMQKFYDSYSHPTHLTIAAGISFSERGSLYVGAAFDDGKIEAYKKEVNVRVGLAKIFPNFVDGVMANVAKR